MPRPEAINTRIQAFDAMDVKIKMDVAMCSEIGEQTLPRGRQESGKLREGDRLAATLEVKGRTPGTNDVTKPVLCGDRRRQPDFPAARYLRLARRGDGGFRVELRRVGLATKHNCLDRTQL